MDTAVMHAVVEHEMLNDTVNNTINNNDQFGNNLASTSTTYGKQDSIFNGAVAPTAPLSAQFEFVNYLPESVLTPGFHNSCLPHLQSLVKPYTPIEMTAPFLTPCDNAPVFLHHPNATASYFPPLSCNEPLLVTPSHGSSDMMMAQHRITPSIMMNGRIEAPSFFQFFGSADPSVAMAMLPTHLAQPWPNLAQGLQVFPDALHQSLELMNRLQILQRQQQQHQHGLEFMNMSAIHPSSNPDDKSSMSSPEKAQTPVDHDHNEDSDFQQNDEDEEECVVESDDGDSSYHDDGNNVSSSSYLDEEEATDSYIDILLHKRRMPSPLSSQSAQGSMEEVPKRRSRTTAKARRRARTPYDPTETVPEAEQLSSSEARLSRHGKSATRFRRVRTPHAPEPEEEATEHTPSKEARVKGRKSRARRTHTEAKEGVDDDDIPLTLPPPNILEDGSIKCSYLGCPRTFATMGLLRSHLVVHVDGKPYVCEMCDGVKRYKRNHDLLRHQREIHGEEEENDERVDDQVDEANDGGDDMNGSEAPVRRRVKREEGSRSRGGLSSGRHRKHRRTRVEHRTIWNGSEMEEIAVEMVRPRGRPRVRPLKDTPAADAFALISSSSSSSSITLTARPQIPSQNADTAKRLHEWLRIEAQATAAWSTVQESTDPFQTQRTEFCPPLFAPLVEEGESNQLIKHEEDELIMTGQWHALNARAADIQSLNSAYALHNLKEWISAPEGSSPRSPGNMVETMFHAPEAPASPTCHVAANIVAAAAERGVTAI
ncbi:hypothetical protein BG000_005056 [Podila horticola]|nr:hypothetical protein BG000_005056 [Podila horticola]